jgi:hypothetical protein
MANDNTKVVINCNRSVAVVVTLVIDSPPHFGSASSP